MSIDFGKRIKSAARVAGLHLAVSALVATIVAVLVFWLWFPHPFDKMIHGRELFVLIIVIDVICGPVLTLVLYNPTKSAFKWRVDVALIVIAQSAALGYGLSQIAGSRPVFIAYEGDRFRVVQAMDIDRESLAMAPSSISSLSLSGPRWLGVKLLAPNDPAFTKSVELAMLGLHPAFRPERWTEYELVSTQLRQSLRPLEELIEKNPGRFDEFQILEQSSGLKIDKLGFLPLVKDTTTDWVVVLRRSDVQPVGYLHMDSWQ